MKNFFGIIAFVFLTMCFSILFLAVLVQLDDSDRQFTNMFALFFVCACVSVVAFLKLDNRKN